MELTDPRVIAQLSNAFQATQTKRPPRPRMTQGAAFSGYQASMHKSRRCKCGKCAVCLENTRWDRIYNEKFADPNYYVKDLTIRFTSPLHTE